MKNLGASPLVLNDNNSVYESNMHFCHSVKVESPKMSTRHTSTSSTFLSMKSKDIIGQQCCVKQKGRSYAGKKSQNSSFQLGMTYVGLSLPVSGKQCRMLIFYCTDTTKIST